jgi:gas vesicle protein
MEQSKMTSKLTADAFLMGLIGGALAALLLSPRSGVENRQRIKQAAKNAREKMDSKKETAMSTLESVKSKVHSAKDSSDNDTSSNSNDNDQSSISNDSIKAAVEEAKTTSNISAKAANDAKKEAKKLP